MRWCSLGMTAEDAFSILGNNAPLGPAGVVDHWQSFAVVPHLGATSSPPRAQEQGPAAKGR
jgi:hypothetical protein